MRIIERIDLKNFIDFFNKFNKKKHIFILNYANIIKKHST